MSTELIARLTTMNFNIFAEMANADMNHRIDLKPVGENETVIGTLSEEAKRIYILANMIHTEKLRVERSAIKAGLEHELMHNQGLEHDSKECKEYSESIDKYLEIMNNLELRFQSVVNVFWGLVSLSYFSEISGNHVAIREGDVIVTFPEEESSEDVLAEAIERALGHSINNMRSATMDYSNDPFLEMLRGKQTPN